MCMCVWYASVTVFIYSSIFNGFNRLLDLWVYNVIDVGLIIYIISIIYKYPSNPSPTVRYSVTSTEYFIFMGRNTLFRFKKSNLLRRRSIVRFYTYIYTYVYHYFHFRFFGIQRLRYKQYQIYIYIYIFICYTIFRESDILCFTSTYIFRVL
jgi:hypothetical protein